MTISLTGRRILIIGGSSGIGLELARQAHAAGAEVTIAGRSAEKLASAVRGLGGSARSAVVDIGEPETVRAALGRIGELDHLVTTAADLAFAPFARLTAAQVERGLRSKVVGAFFAAQAAASHLRVGGSITFFSGAAAYKPGPGTALVATANAALEGLAKALAVELAPIRVNVISPGLVDTPVWAGLTAAQRKAMFEQTAARLPARRIGTAPDVAAAALAVMLNPFITGTVLHVDGGARLA